LSLGFFILFSKKAEIIKKLGELEVGILGTLGAVETIFNLGDRIDELRKKVVIVVHLMIAIIQLIIMGIIITNRSLNLIIHQTIAILTQELAILTTVLIKNNTFFNYSFFNDNLKYCYFIPFIFNKLSKEIPADADFIIHYSFYMFILSLITLVCFINALAYLITLHLVNKYDIHNKYPKFEKLIKYFEKSTFFMVIIELIIGISFLIIIIILNLWLCGLLTWNFKF
jgi:hypothetical protein